MAELDAGALFGVKGLIVVVTGGATGIGLMIAQALEANGATVYILGRRQGVLEDAAKTGKHGNIHAIKADVTSKPALEAAAEHVKQKHGYVNLVIANSGINGPDLYSLPPDASFEQVRHYLQKIETQEYHDTFAVNTTGVMLTLVAFLDLLNKGNEACNVEQHSQFLAVTSVGGYNRMSMAGLAYNASKAAANHLIKQFATRLAPFRIRANAIAPGVYPSEMGQYLVDSYASGVIPKEMIPVSRVGDVKDMAGAILFLASRAGAYVNGNILLTDGGALSTLPASY